MRPTIVVVDDEEQIRSLLQDALQTKGYEVVTCGNGHEAVDVAKTLAQGDTFCVVLLDIKMPVLNGVETLKGLKQVLPHAAYVMITGYSSIELVEESFQEGAVLCLAKPVGIGEIIEVIDGIITEQEREAQHLKSVPPTFGAQHLEAVASS